MGREEVELSLFADDMILYIENPKFSTQKLLELINELRKLAGYKIDIQKSVVFLYTDNEISEKESKKKKSHLKFALKKKKKTLGINLTKEVKDQYARGPHPPGHGLVLIFSLLGTELHSRR